MADYDAVLVGSGINSLACAAFLARAGWRVAVLEREAELGGAVRTAELTEPGFHHDVFSAWHPLWVGGPAHAELGAALAERGLEYLNTEHPTGTLLSGRQERVPHDEHRGKRSGARASRRRRRRAPGERRSRAIGAQAELVFGVLGTELWSRAGLSLGAKAYRRLGRRGLAEFGAEVVQSSRDWLTTTFRSERAHGLLAPWVLHTGLGPGCRRVGIHDPRDRLRDRSRRHAGSARRRRAARRCARAADSRITAAFARPAGTWSEFSSRTGRATGVRLAGGDIVGAERAVICNVTPTQLYGRLLDPADVPAGVAEAAQAIPLRPLRRCRFTSPCRSRRAGRVTSVSARRRSFISRPGLDGVSRAVNEADRGLLPAEATVVVGQPLTVDDSRAPAGKGILWIQLQELPWHVKGDAAGELDVGDGTWNESLRERYADRIQARIARHIPNLESSILRRVVLSPADLQEANINLERGDPYSGSLALDQNFLWRPFARQPGHRTAVDGLFHIGASTWPGPGLGAGSGTLVAKALLQPPAAQRLVGRLGAFLRPGQA